MKKEKKYVINIIYYFLKKLVRKMDELIAISLYQDYENNKDDDNDISATLMNRTESIMLAGTKIKKNDGCC